MNTPPSSSFTPLSLSSVFTDDRAELDPQLGLIEYPARTFGASSFRGMPFDMGLPGEANVVVLDDREIRIETGPITPRPDAVRYKRIRMTLESAHTRLHQQMHRNGISHEHTLLRDHHEHD